MSQEVAGTTQNFRLLAGDTRGVVAPVGWLAGAAYCGLKTPGPNKDDIAIITSDRPATVAAVFTTNTVKAAPVLWSASVTNRGLAQAIVVNAGNANACTGEQGRKDTARMAELTATKLGFDDVFTVLVASTGIIGHHLPMDKVEAGIAAITLGDGGERVARAIMTTDTRPKRAVAEVTLTDGTMITLGAMCKGAGMIHPNMATMLAFVTTDAAINAQTLKFAVREAADRSFNAVTVDGDTSTNDSLFVLANGAAGNPQIGAAGNPPEDEARFVAALNALLTYLAREIARDGEGATKLIEVRVQNAMREAEARHGARTVAGSNLLKAAIFGRDPNWGRALAALGRSGITFDPQRVDITFGAGDHSIVVMRGGTPQPFDKAAAQNLLGADEIAITIDLHQGDDCEGVAWGCDLTQEYVVINSEYET